MSCDYRIQGEAGVRNTSEVMDAINQLKSEVRGEDYVAVTYLHSSILDLSVNYDDITIIHTPEHFGDFFGDYGPSRDWMWCLRDRNKRRDMDRMDRRGTRYNGEQEQSGSN